MSFLETVEQGPGFLPETDSHLCGVTQPLQKRTAVPTEHLRAPCGLEPQVLLHTNTIKILSVVAAKSLSL